jgi:hypothetical protein
MKLNSIDELYQFLEKVEDYGENNSFINDFSELRDHYKNEGIQEIADKIQLEMIASEFYLVKGELRGKYKFKDNTGKLIESPDCKVLTKENIEYYKQRTKQTQNFYVKARYAHIVWQSQWKHLEYLTTAIENYLLSTTDLRKKDEMFPEKFFGLQIASTVKTIIYLAQQAKIDESLKNQIKEEVKRLIFNFNFESSSFFALRADLIETSLEYKKFFGKEFFIGMDEECERVSEKLKSKQNPDGQIVILEIASKVSKYSGNEKHTKYIESIGLLHQSKAEYLALQLEYLTALHFADLAIRKYKENKQQDKIDYLVTKIIEWKQKLNFKRIETSIPVSEEYEAHKTDLLNNFSKLSGEELLLAIAFSPALIPESERVISVAASTNQEQSFSNLFPIEIIDHYSNLVQKFTTEQEKRKYNQLTTYNMMLRNFQLPLIRNIIFTAIQEERLTLNYLIDFFSKYAWFAKSYPKKLPNGSTVEVNWLSLIYPSLKEFFGKVEEMIKTKEGTDFILAIDSLTLKLEGIIRNLCEILGIPVFYDKDGLKFQKDINQLLKEEKLITQLSQDDILFLEFLLIEKTGFNLRNRVGHSLLFFQEYGFDLMILLLMTLLRLSGYEIEVQNKEEGIL